MLNEKTSIDSVIAQAEHCHYPQEIILNEKHFQCTDHLRLLANRRLVVKARDNDGNQVVIKYFASNKKGQKDFKREQQGIALIQKSDVRVPELLDTVKKTATGSALIFDYIPESQAFSLKDRPEKHISMLYELMSRLHSAGMYQDDIHPDNILMNPQGLTLIDLGTVRAFSDDSVASKEDSLDNLAKLVAQFEVEYRPLLLESLPSYFGSRGWVFTASDRVEFEQRLQQAWYTRKKQFLKKCFRDCTMTFYRQRFDWQVAAKREFWQQANIESITDIEKQFAGGKVLKSGNTATVIKTQLAGRDVVIKRYNIKSLWHFLSRCWRSSRAANSWLSANLLEFIGISTAKPLAFIEHRFGPIRRTAYFISEYRAADEMLVSYEDRMPTESETQQIQQIFSQLRQMNIGHGDMKAQNLLVDEQGFIMLIDLDAMREYSNDKKGAIAHFRDKKRFLKNWSNPELEAYFRVMLQRTDRKL